MLRLDRQRLAEAAMPYRTGLQSRFDDVDMQGHLNNAAIAVLLQEARIRYAHDRFGAALAERYSIVVGSIFIDYAGELLFPGTIEIGVGVLEIGRSSFVLGNVACQNGSIATFAEVALILTDRARPVTIPDDIRARMERDRIAGTD